MNSPFQPYLGTNYVPTVNEAKQINDMLQSCSFEAHILDSEISHMQQQLDALHQKRSEMTSFMEQHQMLISPVRRLTHDIVLEIFFACLPSDRNPCMSAREAPMLLTHVCSSWRALAMSTPRLWAAIHIVLPNITFRPELSSPRSFVQLQTDVVRRTLYHRRIAVKEWLDRSGACPLSISVFGDDRARMPGFQISEQGFMCAQAIHQLHASFIREIIVPYHQRWYHLDLSLTHALFKDLLETGVTAVSLIMLKKLSVCCRIINNLRSILWNDILVSLLPPHATCVAFYGIPFMSSDISSLTSHNWSRLRELDLHIFNSTAHSFDAAPVAPTVLSEVLSQCKFLNTLKLNIWDVPTRGMEILTEATIVLEHLERMTIFIRSPDVAARSFVQRLYLPVLKELDFQLDSNNDPNLFEISEGVIKSLVGNSQNFTSLRLSLPLWLKSHMDLVRFLSGMPDLKCLRLSSYQPGSNHILEQTPEVRLQHVVNDGLLLALIPSGKDFIDIICPSLHTIICDCDVITGITETALKEFVKAWKSVQNNTGFNRQISVAVNDYKMEEEVEEEKVTLGNDSSIYFRKNDSDLLYEISSPYLGIVEGRDEVPRSSYVNSHYDVYREF